MPIDPAVVIATWTTKPLRSCCYGSPWNSWRAVAGRGCGKQVFWSSLHTLTPKLLLEEKKKKEDLGILKMSIWNFLPAIQEPLYDQKGWKLWIFHFICGFLQTCVTTKASSEIKWLKWSKFFLSGFARRIRAYLIIDMSKCCTRCNTETIISQEAVKHFCGE